MIDLLISSCCVGFGTPIPILPAAHPNEVGRLLAKRVFPIFIVLDDVADCALAFAPRNILLEPVVTLDQAL